MNTKHDLEVIINNKRYTLCGYESEEYLQRVASYINGKYAELKKNTEYPKIESDLRNILLEINIADDYFKATRQLQELDEELEIKNKEIFDVKHDVITIQGKNDTLQKQLDEMTEKYNEMQKQIIRLEAEKESQPKRNTTNHR